MDQIKAINLREQARGQIRAAIVMGNVIAGEIYPVTFFASQLKVSATPVREALLDLANEGLVEPARNKGFSNPHAVRA